MRPAWGQEDLKGRIWICVIIENSDSTSIHIHYLSLHLSHPQRDASLKNRLKNARKRASTSLLKFVPRKDGNPPLGTCLTVLALWVPVPARKWMCRDWGVENSLNWHVGTSVKILLGIQLETWKCVQDDFDWFLFFLLMYLTHFLAHSGK